MAGRRLTNRHVYLYASEELAEELLDVPKGSIVTVRGVTAYGTIKEVEWTADGPITKTVEHRGVVIRELRDIRPPK